MKTVDGLPVDYTDLPAHLRAGMERYIEQHIRTGSFLHAVLCDRFGDAVLGYSGDSLGELQAIERWLIYHPPPDCWGSTERVNAWLAKRAA